MWLQDLTLNCRITVKKISGEFNTADLTTKYLSGVQTVNDMKKLGFAAEEGLQVELDGTRPTLTLSPFPSPLRHSSDDTVQAIREMRAKAP